MKLGCTESTVNMKENRFLKDVWTTISSCRSVVNGYEDAKVKLMAVLRKYCHAFDIKK